MLPAAEGYSAVTMLAAVGQAKVMALAGAAEGYSAVTMLAAVGQAKVMALAGAAEGYPAVTMLAAVGQAMLTALAAAAEVYSAIWMHDPVYHSATMKPPAAVVKVCGALQTSAVVVVAVKAYQYYRLLPTRPTSVSVSSAVPNLSH